MPTIDERCYGHEPATKQLLWLRAENERLQRIIDSRPAINAGLPETYISWSASVGEMEFMRVVCAKN